MPGLVSWSMTHGLINRETPGKTMSGGLETQEGVNFRLGGFLGVKGTEKGVIFGVGSPVDVSGPIPDDFVRVLCPDFDSDIITFIHVSIISVTGDLSSRIQLGLFVGDNPRPAVFGRTDDVEKPICVGVGFWGVHFEFFEGDFDLTTTGGAVSGVDSGNGVGLRDACFDDIHTSLV